MSQVLDALTNVIINGDSRYALTLFPDNSVDIIITSPQYSFGKSYDSTDDTISPMKYLASLVPIWQQCYRILKPDGRICIDVQPVFSAGVPTHHVIWHQLHKIGFKWKSEHEWMKGCNTRHSQFGSYGSPSAPYIMYPWEYIDIYYKEDPKKHGNNENIDMTEIEFVEWRKAEWYFQPEPNQEDTYGHPAVFPEALPRRLLKFYSFRGDFVVDPFNGVGTTAKVAYELGWRFAGIDISKAYCKTALKRVLNVYQQQSFSGSRVDRTKQPRFINAVVRRSISDTIDEIDSTTKNIDDILTCRWFKDESSEIRCKSFCNCVINPNDCEKCDRYQPSLPTQKLRTLIRERFGEV